MKPRTVTLRIELQTDAPISVLRNLRSMACVVESGRSSGYRYLSRCYPKPVDDISEPGEIVQVSVDVAQPAKKVGARVPKRKGAK